MRSRIQLPDAARRGEVIAIRVVIQHAMETGLRRDVDGNRVRRNVINAFSCRYNGIEVFRAALSSGISANPLLEFHTVALESGVLEFSWIDDAGVQGIERRPIAVTA